MDDPSRLLQVGGGFVSLPGRSQRKVPKRPSFEEQPIMAEWSVSGRPSDLVQVYAFAQKLGVRVVWLERGRNPVEASAPAKKAPVGGDQ